MSITTQFLWYNFCVDRDTGFCYSRGMEADELLTVQEAAEWLGVGDTAVRNAMLRGRLPFVRRYGRKLIALPELAAYKERTRPGRPPKQTEQEEKTPEAEGR